MIGAPEPNTERNSSQGCNKSHAVRYRSVNEDVGDEAVETSDWRSGRSPAHLREGFGFLQPPRSPAVCFRSTVPNTLLRTCDRMTAIGHTERRRSRR